MSAHNTPQSPEPPGRPRRVKWNKEHDPLPPDSYVVEPHENFIRDQFMVTGVEGDIDQLIQDSPRSSPISDLPQGLIEEIDLGPLGNPLLDVPWGEPGTESGSPSQRLVARVYRLPEGLGLDGTLDEFYRQAASGRGYRAFAEPSYLTGGSPGCIEGGPAVPPGSGAAAEPLFWKQWAFGTNGIELSPGALAVEKGNVRVAVFDTSPFLEPGQYCLGQIHPKLDLSVWHPELLPNMISDTRTTPPQAGSFMAGRYHDHGLFVSSLVHAVAPSSHIYLIRVLNGHNLGNVPTLLKSLRAFLVRDRAARGGTLKGTVVNLSLGLVDEPGPERPLLYDMPGRIWNLHDFLGTRSLLSGERIAAVALYLLLKAAAEDGAVIVACTGNGSNGSKAEATEAPASYPFVIGVAGHTIKRRRSSFSNKGEIAAPAGDGPPGNPLKPDGSRKNDDDWLVGLSMQNHSDPGYMFWMGTSFAAPLVAGNAAHGLGNGQPPWQVRQNILASVTNPAGDPNLGVGCAKVP